MSEERVSWLVFSVKLPQYRGKKTVKIELFKAKQWKLSVSLEDRNAAPPIPCRLHKKNEYFDERFRLRIDDRWYKEQGKQYAFLTFDEAMEVVKGRGKEMVV